MPGLINNAVVFINFLLIICCFQLEPDTDRCAFLTVPEEWKIVDDIMQQAENGIHEEGTYTVKSCSSLITYCMIQEFLWP